MKRLLIHATCALLIAATAAAQGMFPSQTFHVSNLSISVSTLQDFNNGATACQNALAVKCGQFDYTTCAEFGVKYITTTVTNVQYAGTLEVAPGVFRNLYLCSGDCTARCKVRDEVNPDTHGCPIILDLGRETLALTDAADGVSFDIDDDGIADRIAWTAGDADDAFLVADLDGDGVISSGRELFGTASPQPASAQPHGYKALAAYDDPQQGGDGDGWITAADLLFPRLQAWVDRDHDGVSDSDELQSLSSIGVAAIGLDYSEQRKKDRYGNEFRYRGWVLRTDGSRSKSWDVFFVRN